MKKFIALITFALMLAASSMAQLTLPNFGTTGVWNGQNPTSNVRYGDNIRKFADGVYTNMAKLDVYKLNALGSPLIAVNYDPLRAKDSVALVDNQLLLVSLVLDKNATLTGVKTLSSVSNNAIQGATINRIGLYKFSNDTLATLVASSANDTTLWTTTRGIYSKAFSATYAATPGVYMIGIVYNYVSATTAGQIFYDNLRLPALDFGTNGKKIAATIASQNDLPSSVNIKAETSVVSLKRIWAGLY